MRRLLPLLPLTGLGACADGYKGLENTHQPAVSANAATVAGCPNWQVPRLGANEGQASNHGCATATNLAAMIADPRDLLHGRADGANSPEVATRAIKAWREIQPTSKMYQVQTSASSKGSS